MKKNLRALIVLISIVVCFGQVIAQSQTATLVVRGKVIAMNDKQPLIGVSVVEKDKENRVIGGTSTNLNGEFVLRITNQNNKIEFTYVGFNSQTMSLKNATVFNVTLHEKESVIGEVTVKSTRKSTHDQMGIPVREQSASMQSINTKEFEGLSVSSVDDALQGRISGLDIVANSAEPGSGMSMRIRGTTSLNANSNPLIVVNGVPFETTIDNNFDFSTANDEQYASLISISPDDIEEITVLKDAAATAVWGSKAANGVIVINTKKGARGKTKVQYSYRYTYGEIPSTIRLLNGDEYTKMMKEAILNPKLLQEGHSELDYNPTFSEYQQYNNNTDWVKAITQSGYTHDHNISLSGGGDRARYRISTGYFNQRGTIVGQQLTRFTNRSYLEYNVTDRMLFTTDFAYTYVNNDKVYKSSGVFSDDVLGVAMRKMPNLSIYKQDADGNNTSEYYNILANSEINSAQKSLPNVVELVYSATNKEITNRVTPTFRLRYDFIDPSKSILRYNGYVSFDVNDLKINLFYPKDLTGSSAIWSGSSVNNASEAESRSIAVQTENSLLWQPKFDNNDHSVLVYTAVQTNSTTSTGDSYTTYGHSSGSLTDASSASYLSGLLSSNSDYRTVGFILKSHYAYLGRYIADFTIRRDGSSRFGANRRWGNFPALSGRWIMSDEPFMKTLKKQINMLAFRASYGVSGNSPSKDALYYSNYYTYNTAYAGLSAVYPGNIQLSDLRWEKNTQWDLGSNIEFLDGKIVIDMDVYHRRTSDMLTQGLSIPTSSGFSSLAYQNVGAMDNDGYELNINLNKIVKTKDFSMDVNFNFSNYGNIIRELSPLASTSYNALNRSDSYSLNNGEYLAYNQIGTPVGSIYGFKFSGVYQYNTYVAGSQENAPVARDENDIPILDKDGFTKAMYFNYGGSTAYKFKGGDAIYEDVNHDGSIDNQDVQYLGTIAPKLTGGFGATLRYKSFSLSTFFNYRYGNKIINASRMNLENMFTYDNQSAAVNWRWRKDGDVTNMPRAMYQSGYNWLGSDRFIEDGSFLRWKYLTIAYSTPKSLLKKLGVEELKFYCTMNNLMLFTNYTGLDPEVSLSTGVDYTKTPRSRDVLFGMSIAF